MHSSSFGSPFGGYTKDILYCQKQIAIMTPVQKICKQKQPFAEAFQNNCFQKISQHSQENACVGVSF